MGRPPLTLNGWLRYDVVERLLGDLDGVRTVLELGAGEGALAVRLVERYEYVGLEPDVQSFRRARGRLERAGRGTIVPGDLSAIAAGATFDLVCAFELLEHLEDDAGALREWRERIRPGGWLLVSVPAFDRRFGAWDVKAGHFQRYERGGLTELLRTTGYAEPLVEAYGFPLGNALERARHLVAQGWKAAGSSAERTAASGRLLQPPERLGWLTQGISAPFRRLQRPFVARDVGIGFVALAQRPP